MRDKVYHFLVLFSVTILVVNFYHLIYALIFAISISIGKEVWDYITRQEFSIADLIADFLGIITGILFYFLVPNL